MVVIKNTTWILVLVVVTVMLCGCKTTPEAPAGRLEGETAPVFNVYQIVPKEVVKGANYRISRQVTVEEYQYVFEVESDFGKFSANGRDMLDLRLRELKAIEEAEKLSSDPHLVNGVLAPLKDTGKGLEIFVDEPLESIGRLPKGFGLMASQYLDPADQRAGSYERRKLAVELECDPETRNPVLKKLLDDMALQLGGGSLITRAGMFFVPGLSLLPMTAQMKDTIVTNPPSEINKRIDKELEAADIEKSVRTRFCKSKAFTTMQRLQLMEQFRILEDVENRASLIEAAALAHTEAEALSCIHVGKMLVDIRERRSIKKLEFFGLSLAVLSDGRNVLISPYDYVTYTIEVADCLNGYRESNPNVTTVFVTAGGVSPSAREAIEGVGMRIIEEGAKDW